MKGLIRINIKIRRQVTYIYMLKINKQKHDKHSARSKAPIYVAEQNKIK